MKGFGIFITFASIVVTVVIYVVQNEENKKLEQELYTTQLLLKRTRENLENLEGNYEEVLEIELKENRIKNQLLNHRLAYQSWNTNNIKIAESISHHKLYVNNNCHKDIRISLCFQDFEENWITIGWFNLDAGKTKFIANAGNKCFYYYAEVKNTNYAWNGNNDDESITEPISENDFFFRINYDDIEGSEKKKYRKHIMKSDNYYTLKLSCENIK